MTELNHAFTSIASTTQACFRPAGKESVCMDLQTRINKIAEHLIKQRRYTTRTWKRAMAEAAGCSYQNIRQASAGENNSMDQAKLRRIAAWANVSERFVVDGIGPLLVYDTHTANSHIAAEPLAVSHTHVPHKEGSKAPQPFFAATKLQRAPVIAWARLGVELLADSQEIEADLRLPVTEGVSARGKWAISDVDQPRFGIKRGYKVLLDPIREPSDCVDGDIYLFHSETKGFFLAEFRRMTKNEYEAIPDAGPPLDTTRHGIVVVAEHIGTYKK